MDIIVPRDFTLDSSNVSESLHSEWDSGTTYASGDRVYVTLESDGTTERTPHEIYESSVDSNSGNYPPDSPSEWTLVGATNRWAMFDQFVTSQTTNTNTIEVKLTASKIDQIALLNMEGEEVQIVAKDGSGTVISDETISLRLDESTSWSEYFFGDFERRKDLVRDIAGLFLNSTIEVTITAATGVAAKCGFLILGRRVFLGMTQWGVDAGIEDFSRKETNSFGETTITKRAFAKTIDADLFVETSPNGREFDRVQRILAERRSTPVVWNFNNDTDRQALIVYGFYRDFGLVAEFATVTQCSLEIEGLI